MMKPNDRPAPYVGRAYRITEAGWQHLHDDSPRTPASETARFREALDAVVERYGVLRSTERNPRAAETLAFHLAILQDPDATSGIFDDISAGLSAEAAVSRCYETGATAMSALDDYFSARKEDFWDVRDRLLERLVGKCPSGTRVAFLEPTILVCDSLSTGGLLRFSLENVIAVVAGVAGTNSHAAIILAAAAIPLVIDPHLAAMVADGEIIAVDIWQNKSDVAVAADSPVPADDVEILPTVNFLAEMKRPGFERFAGIGVFRTEFLRSRSGGFPTVEEQVRSYEAVLAAIPGKPVRFRLFDVQPDKSWSADGGAVGTRFLLQHPAVLDNQLDALMAVAIKREIGILVPMVELPEDGLAMLRAVSAAKRRLLDFMPDANPRYRVGAMIETIKSVSSLPRMNGFDFYSIGTNDLCADAFGRTRTASDFDPVLFLHPRFTDLIRQIAETAAIQRIPVSLCGAAADYPEAIRMAVSLGIRSFAPSVSVAFTVFPAIVGDALK